MKRKLMITLTVLMAGSVGLLNASYHADEKTDTANPVVFEPKQENNDDQDLDIEEALENETVSDDVTKEVKTKQIEKTNSKTSKTVEVYTNKADEKPSSTQAAETKQKSSENTDKKDNTIKSANESAVNSNPVSQPVQENKSPNTQDQTTAQVSQKENTADAVKQESPSYHYDTGNCGVLYDSESEAYAVAEAKFNDFSDPEKYVSSYVVYSTYDKWTISYYYSYY